MLIVFFNGSVAHGVWTGPGSRRAKPAREPFSSFISARWRRGIAFRFPRASVLLKGIVEESSSPRRLSPSVAHGTTASLRSS